MPELDGYACGSMEPRSAKSACKVYKIQGPQIGDGSAPHNQPSSWVGALCACKAARKYPQFHTNAKSGNNMVKSESLGVRVEPEIKAALERAAADDHRSMASLIEKILAEFLRDHGYLETPKRKGRK